MTGRRDAQRFTAAVRTLVNKVIGEDALTEADDDEPLFERRILDSLSLLTIMVSFQVRFDVQVAPEDLVPANFGSVSAMARFVAVKQEARR